MVTNDVLELKPGLFCYAALLDRKGRIQADLYVLAQPDSFLLDIAVDRGRVVAETLERYIIADDVQVLDESEDSGHVGIEGPGGAELLSNLGLPAPAPGSFVREPWRETPLLCVGRGSVTSVGVQVLGPPSEIGELVSSLEIPRITPEAAEMLRLEEFLPRCGTDFSERNFPAEARLERAVSTTKGCYIGQEIVARIRTRGRVNRLLVQMRTEKPVAPGDPIACEGAPEGKVTSAVVSPVSGPLALGYVRSAHASPGTKVRIGETPGQVIGPPETPG